MSGWKKLANAPAASGGLNIEDVFSTYLYKGNGSSQTITNDIDLDGEGGMVWFKDRTAANNHNVYDTERGANYLMRTNTTVASTVVGGGGLTSFNSNGFSVGSYPEVNQNTYDFASWTFRKAPKFFDVVSYTGNGTAGRTVSHNLGSVPGMIWVKCADGGSWVCYHRESDGTAPEDKYFDLDNSRTATDDTYWNDTLPTATQFTVGSQAAVNFNGASYVAYIFAHNDGDGDFGPDGNADIIKCGSYIGNGSTNGPTINLGFEPQFVFVQRMTGTSYGLNFVFDSMRGLTALGATADRVLYPGESLAEANYETFSVLPDGFKLTSSQSAVNKSGDRYIYMAIRRGPMAVPTASTDVFAIDDRDNYNTAPQTGYGYQSNFPVDLLIRNGYIGVYNDGGFEAADILNARLLQGYYLTTNENAGKSGDGGADFDHMNGCYEGGTADTKNIGLMWRRAPKFFDIATHRGTGVAKTVPHNLGAVPEMMISKIHSGASDWAVYHKDQDATAPQDYFLELNRTQAPTNNDGWWNDTAPTDTVFTVNDNPGVNQSGDDYIVLLFATLSGISKVGSYTGTGSTLNVDCGFSTGARFVLIKRIDATGDWYAFNSQTGIVAGNDYYAKWNVNATYSNSDFIDPLNSGFTVTSTAPADLNANGGTYIFYAVA